MARTSGVFPAKACVSEAGVRLLDAVDQVDRLAEWVGDSFRKDLLRLHGMANTIINNAPKTISSDQEKIWELAGSLAMELEEMVEDLGATLEGLHQLAKLAPRVR